MPETARRPIVRPPARIPPLSSAIGLGQILVVGVLAAVNLYLAGRSIGLIVGGSPAVDWTQYVEAARRVEGGDLYAVTDTYAFHYSPLAAYGFALLTALGTVGWRLLHLLAVVAMPTWQMRILTAASWPFWYDVETGNVLVFAVLAAAWAVRGSRIGTVAFLVLAILVPRPLMLPIAAWLLWKQPQVRLPFAIAFVLHGLVVVSLGWGGPWLAAMAAATADVANPSNVGPSRFIGTLAWMLIGLPLAAWLTWRGRLGMAALAASPYWLPYYLLVLVLEAPARWWTPRHAARSTTA